ncbi:hypothetical protein QNA08_17930 [Chelatococcus sp. SYSU_G07232]|uniref:Uncharacterized protein n=1 Tax=Chelatococcus albus TaxID=3047466 RepID=A0ABT7AL37_9HYPH|nr:hypothetical protein [Chelatococcus sp. SYSU_G07232]MDJ1160094.1 hypothetical protein [Chelatococcus sp. SYSU_G07232]
MDRVEDVDRRRGRVLAQEIALLAAIFEAGQHHVLGTEEAEAVGRLQLVEVVALGYGEEIVAAAERPTIRRECAVARAELLDVGIAHPEDVAQRPVRRRRIGHGHGAVDDIGALVVERLTEEGAARHTDGPPLEGGDAPVGRTFVVQVLDLAEHLEIGRGPVGKGRGDEVALRVDEVAEAVGILDGAVEAIEERRVADAPAEVPFQALVAEAAARQRERARGIARRLARDEVEEAARRAAPVERGRGSLEHLDALDIGEVPVLLEGVVAHAVLEHVRERREAADGEIIARALALQGEDAARERGDVLQPLRIPFLDHLPRDRLDGLRGLDERRRRLERGREAGGQGAEEAATNGQPRHVDRRQFDGARGRARDAVLGRSRLHRCQGERGAERRRREKAGRQGAGPPACHAGSGLVIVTHHWLLSAGCKARPRVDTGGMEAAFCEAAVAQSAQSRTLPARRSFVDGSRLEGELAARGLTRP